MLWLWVIVLIFKIEFQRLRMLFLSARRRFRLGRQAEGQPISLKNYVAFVRHLRIG